VRNKSGRRPGIAKREVAKPPHLACFPLSCVLWLSASASRSGLAADDCDYTRLSTALTDLATWGYIDRRPDPKNKSLRILFVIYDERDDAFVKASRDDNPLPTGKQPCADYVDGGDKNPLPTGKHSSLPTGKDETEIVCPAFETSHEYQQLGGGEYIQQKLRRNSVEAGNRYSTETEDAGERRKRLRA
jgi:hypothetical protein